METILALDNIKSALIMESNKNVQYQKLAKVEGTSISNQIGLEDKKGLPKKTFIVSPKPVKSKFWHESDVIDPSLG